MLRINILPALLLAVVLLTLSACSGAGSGIEMLDPAAPAVDAAAESPEGMVSLPDPEDMPRSTSQTTHSYERGVNRIADYSSPLVSTQGLSAVFAPDYSGSGFDGLAYATYRLVMKDYEGSDELELKWAQAPPSGDVYLGVSNFSSNRWDWFRPGPSNSISLASVNDYTRTENLIQSMFIVVAVTGNSGGVLDLVRIGGDRAPLGKLEASLSFGNAPLAVNFNASESYDADGEIVSYAWDALGNGNFIESTDTYNYLYDVEGLYPMQLRLTDNEGNETILTHYILVGVSQFDETENNDDFEEADQLPSGSFAGYHGVVGPAGSEDGDDEDYYRFNVSQTAAIDIDLFYNPLDAEIFYRLFDLSDGEIVMATSEKDNNHQLLHASLEPGEYGLYVVNYSHRYLQEDKTGEYSLSMDYVYTSAPYLNLHVAPLVGNAPFELSVDTSDSADTGFGSIESYEFDLYGDGDYETLLPNSGLTGHVVKRVGTFMLRVRITDNDGFQVVQEVEYVSNGPATDENEPNNNDETAEQLELQTLDFSGDLGINSGVFDVSDRFIYSAEESVAVGLSVAYDDYHCNLHLNVYEKNGGNWDYIGSSATNDGLEEFNWSLDGGKDYLITLTAFKGSSAYELDFIYN